MSSHPASKQEIFISFCTMSRNHGHWVRSDVLSESAASSTLCCPLRQSYGHTNEEIGILWSSPGGRMQVLRIGR